MASILIVEPNNNFRALQDQVLRHAGHEVHAVADGSAARQALRRREFDAVVLDLVLPSPVSAVDLLEQIHRARPEKDPSCVALCPLAGLAAHEEYLRAEFDFAEFLVKPIGTDEYRAAVKRALEGRTRRRESRSGRPENRRQAERFRAHLGVKLSTAVGWVQGTLEDIGMGGARLITEVAIAKGGIVQLEADLPGLGTVKLPAEVVHCTPGTQAHVSLRFIALDDGAVNTLSALVEELGRPGRARPLLVLASSSLQPLVEAAARRMGDEEVRVRLVGPYDAVHARAREASPDLVLLDRRWPRSEHEAELCRADRATAMIPVELAQGRVWGRASRPEDDEPGLFARCCEALLASRYRSVRVPWSREVTLTLPTGTYRGRAVDLSESGLQVALENAPPTGTEGELSMTLSSGPLTLPATCARLFAESHDEHFPIRVGLAISPSPEAKERIREEVRSSLAVSLYVRQLSVGSLGPRASTGAANAAV